jgi:hypothetical protein
MDRDLASAGVPTSWRASATRGSANSADGLARLAGEDRLPRPLSGDAFFAPRVVCLAAPGYKTAHHVDERWLVTAVLRGGPRTGGCLPVDQHTRSTPIDAKTTGEKPMDSMGPPFARPAPIRKPKVATVQANGANNRI